jgi:large subunit ribosomal protein L25
VVPIAVEGVDDCPGLRDGGVLDQPVREVTVLALPNEIPESIPVSVEGLVIGENASLASAVMPEGVELVDDPEIVVASILAPRVEVEETVEQETELIGEGEEGGEGAAEEGGEESGGEESGGEDAGGDSGGDSD